MVLASEIHAPLAPLPARWQCDLSDGSLHWTSGVYALFGIAPGAPLSRADIVRMYAGESRDEMERLRARAIAACGSFTMEATILRPDGAKRLMLLSADVHCRNGRAALLHGIKRDITDDPPVSLG